MKSGTKLKNTKKNRQRLTIILLSLTALISLYILLMPYLPRLIYLISKPKINSSPYADASEETKKNNNVSNQEVNKQDGNRLVLPQIGVNSKIIDGRNIDVIGRDQGVWRETPSIDPTKPGNIVLAGHRFIYTVTRGGQFYNLTDLKINDVIYVKWNNKVYSYKVVNSRTVLPTQVEIRDPDPKISHKLTLYTCYPLGSTAKRFVVEASLQ